MRQSEFKKKFNPETGNFTRQHIFDSGTIITGGGITDKFKALIKRKKTSKRPKSPPTPPPSFNTNKKAGDKIAKILSSRNRPQLTREEKVLQIMSSTGGKIM